LRPKWLTAAAIGVIVISVFSILSGLMAPISVAFLLFNPFASMPGVPPDLANSFATHQKALGVAALGVQSVAGVAGLVTGIWASTTSVRVLSRKPDVRVAFRRSTLALALTESANVTVGVWLQVAMGDVMRAAALPAGAPHGVETTMQTFVQVFTLLGIVVAVGWGVIKVVFLAWAHRYAGAPNVVAFLDQ
jgi:hypothetical protein